MPPDLTAALKLEIRRLARKVEDLEDRVSTLEGEDADEEPGSDD